MTERITGYFQELDVEIQCWKNDLDDNLMPLPRAQEMLEFVSFLLEKLLAVIPTDADKRSKLGIPSDWTSGRLVQLKTSLVEHIKLVSVSVSYDHDDLTSFNLEKDGSIPIDLTNAFEAFVALRTVIKSSPQVDSDWMKKSEENVAQFLRASGDMPNPKEGEEKEKKKANVEESYDDDFFFYSSGEEEDMEDEEDTSGDEEY
mgnify:CR=1 FL=1